MPGWDRDVQSDSADRRPYRLLSRSVSRTEVTLRTRRGRIKAVSEQRLDALVVEPSTARFTEPALQLLAKWSVRGERGITQGPCNERADARPGCDEPGVLSSL